MATITGLTAARMLEIEAASVVDGNVVGDDLFLEKHDGSLINAGDVRGPQGPAGPMGESLDVVSFAPVYSVGVANQIRAGRQLTPSDFTNLGLAAPVGLYNLSNFSDSSGNGRTLTNKGAVPLAAGINGVASSAAQFSGAAGQALYIADTGAADPFRIKTGSWGAWFRTAKRGAEQAIISKIGGGGTGSIANRSWGLEVSANNLPMSIISSDGTTNTIAMTGSSDVADDYWHFGVATFDGMWGKLYIDGALEARVMLSAAVHMFQTTAPLNIGNYGADGSVNGVTGTAFYGRIDEAFVSSYVLTQEQIHNLYCASIPHALGSEPKSVSLVVRRRRRGGPIATSDFPSQPTRLYNFTGGVLTDQGSANQPVAATGGGTISDSLGADGAPAGGKMFSGAHTGLASTDAGLPGGTSPRSFGCWMKTSSFAVGQVMSWGGTLNSADIRIGMTTTGALQFGNGGDLPTAAFGVDGEWHHVVEVDDNAAVDGVKRKFYLDGKLIGGSTVLNSITLSGANRFRLGAHADGTLGFNGQIDGAFVFSGVLTFEQVRALYNLGSQQLAASQKDSMDHIDAMEAGRLLGTFETIEGSDLIDLAVMA